MTRRRREIIATVVVGGIFALFTGLGSFYIIQTTAYTDQSLKAIVLRESWSAALLNIATELIGAVLIFLILKILFQLDESVSRDTSSNQDNEPVWKYPLKNAIRLLAENGKLDSGSIGVFQQSLNDGSNRELLNTKDIRDLRIELKHFEDS